MTARKSLNNKKLEQIENEYCSQDYFDSLNDEEFASILENDEEFVKKLDDSDRFFLAMGTSLDQIKRLKRQWYKTRNLKFKDTIGIITKRNYLAQIDISFNHILEEYGFSEEDNLLEPIKQIMEDAKERTYNADTTSEYDCLHLIHLMTELTVVAYAIESTLLVVKKTILGELPLSKKLKFLDDKIAMMSKLQDLFKNQNAIIKNEGEKTRTDVKEAVKDEGERISKTVKDEGKTTREEVKARQQQAIEQTRAAIEGNSERSSKEHKRLASRIKLKEIQTAKIPKLTQARAGELLAEIATAKGMSKFLNSKSNERLIRRYESGEYIPVWYLRVSGLQVTEKMFREIVTQDLTLDEALKKIKKKQHDDKYNIEHPLSLDELKEKRKQMADDRNNEDDEDGGFFDYKEDEEESAWDKAAREIP